MKRMALALLGTICSTAVFAADYYVDQTTGNDNNPCTLAQPCKNPWRLMHVLQPGDVGHVGPGIYAGIYITVSGAPGLPISFVGNGAKIVEPSQQGINFSNGVHHVNVIGFDVVSQQKNGIFLSSGAHHLLIQNNVVHDSPVAGIGGMGNDYVTIVQNTIYNTAKGSPLDSSAISLYQLNNVDNGAQYHNIISGNKIYNNANLVAPSGSQHPSDGNGIIIDDSRHTQNNNTNPPYTGSTLIENNLVFNNGGRGIHVYLSDNVEIRNNTCYANNWAPGGMWRTGEIAAVSSGNVNVQNNIVLPVASTMTDSPRYHYGIVFTQSSGLQNRADYNLSYGGDGPYYSDNIGTPSYGSHNIGSNPLLRNASTDPATADFRPTSMSPAFGAGNPDDYAPYDYSGVTRSVPITVGAYQ